MRVASLARSVAVNPPTPRLSAPSRRSTYRIPIHVVVLLLLPLSLIGGCGGDDAATEPSAMPATPTVSAEPSPGASLASVSEPAAAIAAAVAGGDIDRLIALADTAEIPCVDTGGQGIPGAPLCQEGDPPGTRYSVFNVASCHGFWTADLELQLSTAVDWAGATYAFAKFNVIPVHWPDRWHRGDHVLIFAPADGEPMINAIAFYLDGDRIVRMQRGCNTAESLITGANPPPTVIWRALDLP